MHVSGGRLVDARGHTVQLRGVNRPGLEYRCVSGYPGFISNDAGSNTGATMAYADTVAAAFSKWNDSRGTAINAIRLPLNEQCWLGVNGTPAAYSGAHYQAFVRRLVDRLTSRGLYVVLDLHWSAPGSFKATAQDVAPNADHSTRFWTDVAHMFRDAPDVLFDLMNEPRVWCNAGSGCPYANGTYQQKANWAWNLYREGGSYTYTNADYLSGRNGKTFKVAGTQQLVDAIRWAGASNVILVEGLGWANALDMWSRYAPYDPSHELAASQHQYASSGTNALAPASLDGTIAAAGIPNRYPLIIGEFGEQICPTSSANLAAKTMAWADQHGYSYIAWGWDAGEGCGGPSLVTSDDAGTPTAYGAIVRQHLRDRAR